MKEARYISIAQLAKILGISRIAVYKKVKKGQIRAIRIGRSFAIPTKFLKREVLDALNVKKGPLTEEEKKEIERAVKKTVREYGEVLKRLGRE